MESVYDIPFSALEAALLLKNGVVYENDLRVLMSRIFDIDRHYDIISDWYFEDLPDFSEVTDTTLDKNGKSITILKKGYTLDTVIDGKSVRDILESCASYSGDTVLNYLGYVRPTKKTETVASNRKSKIRSLFKKNNNNSNTVIKVGV